MRTLLGVMLVFAGALAAAYGQTGVGAKYGSRVASEIETAWMPRRPSAMWNGGFLNRERSIPFLTLALPLVIRDKNRMR